MVGLDFNSNPSQYRTWIVSNSPDFDGYFCPLQSGSNALQDISAYLCPTDGYDFNLPLGDQWEPYPIELLNTFAIRKTLPSLISDSSLLVSDGYIYLFGSNLSNKIYQATTNNPQNWIDTGAILPQALYGSSLAVVGNTIYLFGGKNSSAIANIFTASLSNPLHWVQASQTLPIPLAHSSLGMYNGSLYLFGGLTTGGASNNILTASSASPLNWSNTGAHLPQAIYGSSLAQIDGYWQMMGGQTSPNNPSVQISVAPITNPTSWKLDGYLPYQSSFSQFFSIGADGYLIGTMEGSAPTGFTTILQCNFNTPNVFVDTGQVIKGVISHSQLAVIQDRMWLFGGNSLSAIFACNQQVKYSMFNTLDAFNFPTIQTYSQITRVLLPAINNASNPFQALSIPYWITDYNLMGPPIPPVVPAS